jgi:hypothetical protein
MAASVLALETVRGEEPGAAPANRLTISSSPHWVVLSVDRPDQPDVPNYSAAVEDATGRVIWSDTGIRPTSPDTLALMLPSTLFQNGDYTLTLEEAARGGRRAPAARYRFHVTIAR